MPLPTLKETKFNKRAKKHTFVVRVYKPKSGGKAKYFMRVNNQLFIFCTDEQWRRVVCTNVSLKSWALRTFGMHIPSSYRK